MISAIDSIAIILALVSLTVTVVGFFASLKFYRDGVELQQAATRALVALEEKASSIQNQVGGMFERTLDAAINKKEDLSDQYEELQRQLDETTTGLVEDAMTQIGAASETERNRIAELVESRMKSLEDRVSSTQRAAERLALESPVITANVSSLELETLKSLAQHPEPQAFTELSARMDVRKQTTHNTLRRLVDKDLVVREGHQRFAKYSLTSKGRDVANFALYD